MSFWYMRGHVVAGLVGGVLAGIGFGGGAAAVVESMEQGASTTPIVLAGLALGLGLGMVAAAVVEGLGRRNGTSS